MMDLASCDHQTELRQDARDAAQRQGIGGRMAEEPPIRCERQIRPTQLQFLALGLDELKGRLARPRLVKRRA
jgi:hypothetical protein